MVKGEPKKDKIDPKWPADSYEHGHAVSELASDRQGSLSPFGDTTFPLPAEALPYVHPVTVINR
ncbi:MAG TPA: hypothetical protein VHV74_13125 [Pseudonocardiaceae bacterium]|nr:hypothetical protein [Pseudonocardiaceae bacterium]